MDDTPLFTSDRRTRDDSSWSGGDWEAGSASNVDIVDGGLVPVVTNLSGEIGDQFATSFETASVGSIPDGWTNAIHGSNGGAGVDDGRAADGSRSLKNRDPNTGSPSHSHISTAAYSPTGDHAFEFDYYVHGNKNNSGSADSFSFTNLNQVYDATSHNGIQRGFSVNAVNNGSWIAAYDGDGDGGGNNVNLEPAIFDRWVTLRFVVEYSQNRYSVFIDGEQYGPFGFQYNGTSADFPVFANSVDNYTGWIDNFRPA
ncbi:hypothetical protein [Halorubrum sp. AJ67]|uniref:hypothetical protein n=1 Tax=Halorubrum sp. AJ67 TaxID=1173487 RepID=UPI0003DC4D09|nr:hypothetical protein [Halorubrum sp. AJ67]CDK38026.1 hypothetical protein BN903_226 [Halorubrum sp. AJ67]